MNRRLVDRVETIALTFTLIGGVLLIVFYWH